jgi:hypothetical protein
MGKRGFSFKKPKEKVEFIDAPADVKTLAAKLISAHHGGIAEAKICYLARTGKWEKRGKAVYGSAEVVSKKHKHLTDFDFIITVGYRTWNVADDKCKLAIVDHQLSHCCKDVDKEGNPKYYIQDHSVEDFAGIVRRHGLWSAELRIMVDANAEHKQVSMFDDKKTGTEG